MDEALNEIRAHDKECGIRYKHIEGQLEDHKHKFVRLENLITGLYGVIITGGIAIFGVVSTLAFNLIK